jgi:hypothetical protein
MAVKVLMMASISGVPWGTEIFLIALGLVGLNLGIQNRKGKLSLPWASQFKETWFPIRIIGALIPSSICLLSMALFFPAAGGIDSTSKTLSVLSWIACVFLGLVFFGSLIVAVYSVFWKIPTFLSPRPRK